MAENLMDFSLPSESVCKILKLKVKPKATISKGTIIAIYALHTNGQGEHDGNETLKFKSEHFGTVEELLVNEGDVVHPGAQGLPGQRRQATTASVAMVHSIPELQVSKEEAYELAKLDEQRLLKNRKLVLVVDLDQTIIHTTMDNVAPNLPGVCHFQLWGQGKHLPWYHTKMRPGYRAFLEKAATLYELHIFTMGARLYAHTIASYLDPEKKYFSHRILSRDECFDPNLKTANLRSIFPSGDNMVVIIDDRDDVWNYAPNLILVPPYRYFQGTGDINAPPGMPKKDFKATVAGKQAEKEVEETAKESEIEESDAVQTKDASDAEKQTIKDEVVASLVDKGDPFGDKPTLHEQTKDSTQPVEVDGNPKNPQSNADTTQENGDQNPGQIVEEKKKVQEESDDSDDYFLYLEDILERIHKEFYDAYDHLQKNPECENKPSIPDLKIILPALKQKVLAGVNLVFSGVFPTNMNPEQSKAWKVASALGARISPGIICGVKGSASPANATTHLVAAKAGTSKVHTAQRAKSIHIVTPEWLWCCWERWQRVDEHLFKLCPGHVRQSSKSSSRASTPGTSDSETARRLAKNKGKQAGKARVPPDREGDVKRRKLSPDSRADDGGSEGMDAAPAAIKSRQLSLSVEYNPVYSFSSEELESMDREVEDIFDESSSSDSAEDVRSNEESLGSITQAISSSSDESLTAESPRGWTKKRKRRRDSDSDSEQDSTDSSSSAGLSDSEPSSSDEDRMAAEIDDLLTYSKS
ncbi:RNA polymerase II subunit A C-terminal domain phosphatase-like isoform X2 [Acanthaster planci]|uniref:RNA polymerase II subunit A C-terminal domain phosphatase n=1 Tax=Acanthaster planci TaxID=133434 RepID=A0A8B7XND4_ACAPL|nr:RNA polymerase II subunit A C-terminal domain phosphatase-like isoform X2 [Acanthaster planci]